MRQLQTTIAKSIAVALCSVALTMGAEANEEPSWTALLEEFDEQGFSAPVIDSLRNWNSLMPSTGLRTIAPTFPLEPERLVFEAGWGMIKAGYAELSFSVDSTNCLARSSFRGVTNRFVSAFYQVQDFIQSTMDLGGLYPLFFEEHVNEGRYKAKRWILFDHVSRIAATNSKNINKRRKDIVPFEHDLLSMILTVRMMKLEPGNTFMIPCFVQGKSYKVEFTVSKREIITVKAGRFPCIIVEPKLTGQGRNFSKRDKIQIWFSDDSLHMPVQIKSKIAIGSVYGELIEYKRGGLSKTN